MEFGNLLSHQIVNQNRIAAGKEAMPLQKDQLGILGNLVSGVHGFFTGRSARERGENFDVEQAQRQAGINERRFSRTRELDDIRFNASQPFASNPDEQLANIARSRARLSQRADAQIANSNTLAQGVLPGIGKGDFAGQLGVRLEQNRLLKESEQSLKSILQLDQQRLGILQQQRQGLTAQREAFAALNPMERAQAMELGGRLRRGDETLTGTDLEAAGAIGPLQGLLQKRQVAALDKTGQFEQFIRETGDEKEQALAIQAIAQNVKIEIVLDKDIDGLIRKIEGVTGKLDIVGETILKVEDKIINIERQKQAKHGAVIPG